MQRRFVIGIGVVGVAVAVYTGTRLFQAAPQAVAIAPAERAVSATPTTREGLTRTIATLSTRVAANHADEYAAVGLADALIRQARVVGDASLPRQAEAVLSSTIDATDSYLARRMMGAVQLAQHRFLEALDAGQRAQALRPDDPWNYGVIGDAAMELGRYEEAFAAFDRMVSLKPTSAAYARVAYAREVQGDLAGAVTAMRMAIEATSPQDPEGIAWAWAQLGALEIQRGDVDAAATAFDRAAFAFPGHPYALAGQARVASVRGDLDVALDRYRALLDTSPTPEHAAHVGDVLHRRGDAADALAAWAEAERLERDGWKDEAPQPAALALLLAERDLQPAEALRLARDAARGRDDIVTNDALAWALYRNGAIEEAWTASTRARRTGTRDRRVLYHAAAIAAARGDTAQAKALAVRALDGLATFDLIAAPEAQALLRRLSAEDRP